MMTLSPKWDRRSQSHNSNSFSLSKSDLQQVVFLSDLLSRVQGVELEHQTMMEGSELKALLAHCTGTEQYYKHWLGGIVYTNGVKLLAEHGGAYWLIDLIASHQITVKQVLKGRIQAAGYPDQVDSRQVWELEVEGSQAVTTCRIQSDPLSVEPIVQQEIPLTDFPIQGKTRLYLYDGVLLLPSEN